MLQCERLAAVSKHRGEHVTLGSVRLEGSLASTHTRGAPLGAANTPGVSISAA